MTYDSGTENVQKKSGASAGLPSLRRGSLILIPVGVILTLLGLSISGPYGSFNVIALVAGLIILLSGIFCSIAYQAVHAIVEAIDASHRDE